VIKNPLREFIYLDEVSLRSLLSSKKGEITSTTSTEVSRTVENESRDTAGVNVPTFGKVEATSRFQTRNSSTLQTANKATVQSWFRELDQIQDIRLLETVQEVRPFQTTQELTECAHPSICLAEERIERGEIVEFRVRLSADPIFHMITLFSEFKAMATDFPDIMSAHGGLDQFSEVEGVTLVIQRLLAGLIPVRAEILDYVAIEIDGSQYVVHIDAISSLNIEHKPLEIVCVTELDAYWKDIRRVLFSDAEFTMLARVATSKLQTSWTPIKLADLMRVLVPDMSDLLNDATRFLFDPDYIDNSQSDVSSKFKTALLSYAEYLIGDAKLSDADRAKINSGILGLETTDQTVTSQKKAFVFVRKLASEFVDVEVSPERDLELREQARGLVDIPYFISTDRTPHMPDTDHKSEDKSRMFLDVEVVAMYW